MASQYDYFFNGWQITWEHVWQTCESCTAVESYDENTNTITWCDGTASTFVDAESALIAINEMEAS